MHTYFVLWQFCVVFKEKNDAIKSKQSDHDALQSLEEKTKQVNSLQKKLKDLEDQNKNLQQGLENVRTCIQCVMYVLQYVYICSYV